MTKTNKEIILAIFIVLFGAVSWFLLHQFLYFGNSITFLILTVLGFLFFGISIGLGSLLINKKITLFLAFALSLLSFFIFFREQTEAFYYFIVLILIFISLIIYQKRVKHEEKARIKLHFWRIFRKGLPLVFTLICVLVSLTYYFSPSLGNSNPKIEIPRNIFDTVLEPFSGLIRSRMPQGIIEEKELKDALYNLVQSQINNPIVTSKYIPIALAVVLFFVLRIFSIFLIALIVLFSYFATKILLSTGFAKILTTSVEMEDIEI